MTNTSEAEIIVDIDRKAGQIIEKTRYSAWSDDLLEQCRNSNIKTVAICGVDTDQCVLATAIDIFEADLRPIVITDCCASSAHDQQLHDAALQILERFIGPKQLMTLQELLS